MYYIHIRQENRPWFLDSSLLLAKLVSSIKLILCDLSFYNFVYKLIVRINFESIVKIMQYIGTI